LSDLTPKNESFARQSAWRKALAEFGLPRIIILTMFVFLFFLAWMFNMNIPSFAGDVLRRWGIFGILVLAMVPAIQSGIGPNFGVSIGIVAGMVGGVLAIDMGYSGFFAFVADDGMRAFVQVMVAIAIGIIVAIPMGMLYGALLNRVKGSEMAITVYVGFGTVSLFNILWALFPVSASIMVLPATGRGLRQMINLDADFGGVFDQWLLFNVGGMTVRLGLLLVFFIACFLMWIFTKTRIGMMMSAAGSNPNYARASGINVDKMRILGTTISTALGAVGIIVYAQSFGFLQMYGAPLMMGFTVVASVLIGGATVRRARVFDVLLGTFLFNGILVIALPLSTVIIPDVAGVPEMLRLIISNGIILYALTKVKGGTA